MTSKKYKRKPLHSKQKINNLESIERDTISLENPLDEDHYSRQSNLTPEIRKYTDNFPISNGKNNTITQSKVAGHIDLLPKSYP